MKFKGVMPALVTPLDSDERINIDALSKLIEHLLSKKADGFYIGGATGEGHALRISERKVLAEESIKAIRGRGTSIVQVACTDFNAAIELAKHAESVGADAISATPPIFFAYDENDVFNYYKKLAESVHIPLMVYFSPAAGFNISAKFAARMFEIDNVTAIKWTNTNFHQMMQVKELTHGEMNVINGPDEMLLMGLCAGADGGIGTTYNFMLENFRGIYDNFIAGDLSKAQAYQKKAGNIISVLLEYKIIPAAKALVEAMGIEVGNATFPMQHYTDAEKKEMIEKIKAAGWRC